MSDRMNAIRLELQMILTRGRLTPEAVVQAAAEPSNPMHSSFEWDDTKAGHQFRLVQARTLIRAVHFVEVDGRKETIIHVPDEVSVHGRGEYLPATTIAQDVDLYDRARAQADLKLQQAQRAVLELQALRPASKDQFTVALRSLDLARNALMSAN
jgi:hypothetical protein